MYLKTRVCKTVLYPVVMYEIRHRPKQNSERGYWINGGGRFNEKYMAQPKKAVIIG